MVSFVSCSGGRQCQLGVEDGGRVAELCEGWVRRMFSGASSRPARSSASGLCLGLAARAGACPRALDDGWPLPLRCAPAMAKLEFALLDSPAATSIDLEGGQRLLARQRARVRIERGEVSRRMFWSQQQQRGRRVCTRQTAAAEEPLKSKQRAIQGTVPCRPELLHLCGHSAPNHSSLPCNCCGAAVGRGRRLRRRSWEARHEGALLSGRPRA